MFVWFSLNRAFYIDWDDTLKELRVWYNGYRNDGCPITLVGVAFGEEERNITNWLIETA